MDQHTQGEWSIHKFSDTEEREISGDDFATFWNMEIYIGSGDKVIGKARMRRQSDEVDNRCPSVDAEAECRANAALMTAAPDLLAACIKVVNHWEDLHPKDRSQLRAAILKATTAV